MITRKQLNEDITNKKYEVVTVGVVSMMDDYDTIDTTDNWNIRDVQDFLDEQYDEDLANYIDEPLKSKILSIESPKVIEDVGEYFKLSWVVNTNGELSKEEQEELIEYIEGQNSDGWGEGVEQREFDKETDEVQESEDCSECGGSGEVEDGVDEEGETIMSTCPTCDGSGSEDVTNDISTYYYVHPWVSPKFKTTNVDTTSIIREFTGTQNVDMSNRKPRVKLTGQDGNVFNLIGIVSKALKDAGQSDKAAEFRGKAMNAKSYDEALRIMMDYVDVY